MGQTTSISKNCLATILGGGLMTISIIGACIVCCLAAGVLIVIVLGSAQQQRQADALAANGGLGEQNNPIPAGSGVIFEDFTITPLQIIRPANDRISNINEPPAAGSDYVLGRFRVTCHKEGAALCRGHQFKVWLVDSQGNTWGEPTIIIIDDNLDLKEAIGGSSMEGWQVFEFPKQGTLTSIKLQAGLTTLYARPPQG
jgi:hypothetical protein